MLSLVAGKPCNTHWNVYTLGLSGQHSPCIGLRVLTLCRSTRKHTYNDQPSNLIANSNNCTIQVWNRTGSLNARIRMQVTPIVSCTPSVADTHTFQELTNTGISRPWHFLTYRILTESSGCTMGTGVFHRIKEAFIEPKNAPYSSKVANVLSR